MPAAGEPLVNFWRQAADFFALKRNLVVLLIATFVGLLLQLTGSYVAVFIMAASSYLIAIALIHALAPRLTPVTVTQ